jgi:signal transduction histidine kinase
LILDRFRRQACCTSPAAIRYWVLVSVASWLLISLAGIYWRPLRPQSAATILFAMTIGCCANWIRNRTLHCALTGPLFLILGLLSLLSELQVIPFPDLLFWSILVLGVSMAFFLEWRDTARSRNRRPYNGSLI